MSRKISRAHFDKQQPRNKEVGSEHFQKRRKAEESAKDLSAQMRVLQSSKCRCNQTCRGKWSDTRHGSHGYHCKVHYGRYLTLQEQCLTQGHQGRPNSKSQRGTKCSFGVVEFFAGVLAISTAWAACGVPLLGAVEKQHILLQNTKDLHPGVQLCSDANSGLWRTWVFEMPAEVVTGGPPCQPFSGAGPGHGGKHLDATHINTLAEAAHVLGARWVQYENVPKLVQQFKVFFASSVAYYETFQLLLLDTEIVRHDALGGISVRPRVWPVFEHSGVAIFLPPWNYGAGSSSGSSARGCIADAMLRTSEVHTSWYAQGTIIKCSVPVVKTNRVTVVGYLRTGGKQYVAHRGCRVKLLGDSAEYVVLEANDRWMYLFHDNRSRPSWRLVQAARLHSVVQHDEPVYGATGAAPTLRTFKVPPGENSFLIHDGVGVRPLRGIEMWAVHRLSQQVAQNLKHQGASDSDLGRWSGSSIPGQMCDCQVGRLHSRIQLAYSIEAVQAVTDVPWLHVAAPSVKGKWPFKLVLAVVSVEHNFKMLVADVAAFYQACAIYRKPSRRPLLRVPNHGLSPCSCNLTCWVSWQLSWMLRTCALCWLSCL